MTSTKTWEEAAVEGAVVIATGVTAIGTETTTVTATGTGTATGILVVIVVAADQGNEKVTKAFASGYPEVDRRCFRSFASGIAADTPALKTGGEGVADRIVGAGEGTKSKGTTTKQEAWVESYPALFYGGFVLGR